MINFKEIKNSNHLIKIINKKKNTLMEFGLLSRQIKLVLFRKWLKMCLILKKIKFKYKFNVLSQWINNKKLISEIFKSTPKEVKTLAFVDSHGSITPDQVDIFQGNKSI